MLQSWIELMRRKNVDRGKARRYVAQVADANYRTAMRDHDAFVPLVANVPNPAFHVGTAIDSTGTPLDVRVALPELATHWLVQGGTGTGKTTFVTSFVTWALSHGLPIGVVDCKSGFFQTVIQWAGALAYLMAPAERAAFLRRFAVINPFGTALVPMNVCRVPSGVSAEVQAYDVTLALSRLFDTALSLHMENILRHLLLLLIAAELSLVEAPLVLEDEMLRGVVVERYGDTRLKDFFFRTYATLPETSKHALGARLHALMAAENLRLMLGSDDCIDLRGILMRGDPLVTFLGKGLNVPEELVTVIGSLFLQLTFQAAYATEGRHRPYVVVLDEFFHLLDAPGLSARFTTALTTLRSFRVHLCLVMHNFSQTSSALRQTLLDSATLMALFRTSTQNAESFGDFMPDRDPSNHLGGEHRPGLRRSEVRRQLAERLQRLEDRHCFWYDRRQPYRALRIRVPDVPEPHEVAGLTPRELDAFIDHAQLQVGSAALPKSTLSRQLADRRTRLHTLVHPPIQVTPPPSPPKPPSNRRSATKSKRPRVG